MHLRISTSTRKGKTYRYAQLVESYRREDGKPAVRVVAHLGALSDNLVAGIRRALEAERRGESLLLESELPAVLAGSTAANLRYLDLAVLQACWAGWGLSKLLEALGGSSQSDVPLADVVLPLVLQRCTQPGSKLKASRWVPTTALPELLGFRPQSFENTRIHRALDKLSALTPALQEQLVSLLEGRQGRFAALFMDVTDTYFEGRGCPSAQRTKTKSQMPGKWCIGIVLLVNERGYPLRWKVVAAKSHDLTTMKGLIDDIGDAHWLKDTLIVFDRAMGNRCTIAELKAAGLHFLTATHYNAIDSFTADVPHQALAGVDIEGTDASYERDVERVAEAARRAGFEPVNERLFVCDLGVASPVSDDQGGESVGPLRLVAYFNPQLFVDVRRRTAGHCVQIQQRVEALNQELSSAQRSRERDPTYRKFARELERHNYLDCFDIDLEPGTSPSPSGTLIRTFRGTIRRREEAWARRRKYDGFVLLVGHPALPQSGSELVTRYRSRDAVEKGFETIKSVCELRPIFHHTDPKVAAHVTLCMLALFLNRTLEHQLAAAGLPMTASACLEQLASCHLNLHVPKNGAAFYDLTRRAPEQLAILSALRLESLENDTELRNRLTPRSHTAVG